MADVIQLPGASTEPLPKQAHRGRYPKGIAPLWKGLQLRDKRQREEAQRGAEEFERAQADDEDRGEVNEVLGESVEEPEQVQAQAAAYYEAVMALSPMEVAERLELLSREQQLNLLTRWSANLTHLAIALQRP